MDRNLPRCGIWCTDSVDDELDGTCFGECSAQFFLSVYDCVPEALDHGPMLAPIPSHNLSGKRQNVPPQNGDEESLKRAVFLQHLFERSEDAEAIHGVQKEEDKDFQMRTNGEAALLRCSCNLSNEVDQGRPALLILAFLLDQVEEMIHVGEDELVEEVGLVVDYISQFGDGLDV